MAEIDSATILARALKSQGVEYAFGIVGIPINPIPPAVTREGIKYVGMRHEQSAAYAAAMIGYLTGRPGVALTVSGPGMLNAVSGLGNAEVNSWPMILISGATSSAHDGMGGFQSAPQLEAAKLFVKYAARPENPSRIPFHVEQAVRVSLSGRPGPAYIEMADDVITATVDEEQVSYPPRFAGPPRPLADAAGIEAAMKAVESAAQPLVVFGKGAAYSRAETEIQKFIETTQLPFLPSPMAKGLIADDHPLSVAAARTHALQNADLVLLIGVRLNWMMHFGLPPRLKEGVRVVQIDIEPEEIGRNVPAEVSLVGDAKAVVGQLNAYLSEHPWQYPAESTWRTGIQRKTEENVATTAPRLADPAKPMGYYRALKEIQDLLPRDAIVVSEGGATMDISRQVINNYLPRTRLDAGSWGTMGVGLPQAIAAQIANPGRRVIDIEGDSAFGFSGLEIEVACRLKLPICVIILNNNGYGGGPTELLDIDKIPASAYYPDAHYERIITAFNGLGLYVDDPDNLGAAIKQAFAFDGPSIINVVLDNQSRRRAQQFDWHPGVTSREAH